MSSKKIKVFQNNENLCPIARKRSLSKSSPQKSWKLAKLESTSSPSALTIEDLEEMGIGMLDSEESSSSATSSIALVMSGSGIDENSNEATPNQHAPKFFHHQQKYPHIDVSLDVSSDNANQSILDMKNETLKGMANSKSSSNSIQRINSSSNSNSNSNFEIYSDDSLLKEKDLYTFYSTNQKISPFANVPNISNNNCNRNNSTSNLNSPSMNRLLRSPLKAVPINNQKAINISIQQQLPTSSLPDQIQRQENNETPQTSTHIQNQQSNVVSSTSADLTPNPTLQHLPHHQLHQDNAPSHKQRNVHSSLSENYSRKYSPPSSSSSIPSTSQQAILMHQHHQQQIQQQQTQLQKFQKYNLLRNQISLNSMYRNNNSSNSTNDDVFFLYRLNQQNLDKTDHFNRLSDEIVLQIFKWLPKKALIRCGMVSRRFNQCARDESLWTRLDLGGRSLRAGALENILTRGVVILRLAQSQLSHPVFTPEFLENNNSFESKLQFLDLSMATVTKNSLKMLLSHCRQLKKLSLEHVPVNDEICTEIAKNVNLETLNLAMCTGLEPWSIRKMMESLQNLSSLNISWTNLSVDAVTSLVKNITPNILRLNIAGCRKTMFDSHLASLAKRCQQLLELDLSDCSGLTGYAITVICNFKMLEYLSLSRCYLIPAASYVELSNLSTLTYLDIFGMLSDNALELFQNSFPNLGINKFVHSSVARPTVGTRRTSIWGLRTRD